MPAGLNIIVIMSRGITARKRPRLKRPPAQIRGSTHLQGEHCPVNRTQKGILLRHLPPKLNEQPAGPVREIPSGLWPARAPWAPPPHALEQASPARRPVPLLKGTLQPQSGNPELRQRGSDGSQNRRRPSRTGRRSPGLLSP